jgi:hypothetical protein
VLVARPRRDVVGGHESRLVLDLECRVRPREINLLVEVDARGHAHYPSAGLRGSRERSRERLCAVGDAVVLGAVVKNVEDTVAHGYGHVFPNDLARRRNGNEEGAKQKPTPH